MSYEWDFRVLEYLLFVIGLQGKIMEPGAGRIRDVFRIGLQGGGPGRPGRLPPEDGQDRAMSQPEVQHRRPGVDAEIGPHDGAPELVEILDRTYGAAHDAVFGDPEEKHRAAGGEDASHEEAESFDRSGQAIVLLGVSQLEIQQFAYLCHDRIPARAGEPREEMTATLVRVARCEYGPMQGQHDQDGHADFFMRLVSERLQGRQHPSRPRHSQHEAGYELESDPNGDKHMQDSREAAVFHACSVRQFNGYGRNHKARIARRY